MYSTPSAVMLKSMLSARVTNFFCSRNQIVNSRCSRGVPVISSTSSCERLGAYRLRPASGVEHFENGHSDNLFGFEVIFRAGRLRHEPPALLAALLVADVVSRPLLRIAQDLIGLADRAKAALVAGFRVVRMKSRG